MPRPVPSSRTSKLFRSEYRFPQSQKNGEPFGSPITAPIVSTLEGRPQRELSEPAFVMIAAVAKLLSPPLSPVTSNGVVWAEVIQIWRKGIHVVVLKMLNPSARNSRPNAQSIELLAYRRIQVPCPWPLKAFRAVIPAGNGPGRYSPIPH